MGTKGLDENLTDYNLHYYQDQKDCVLRVRLLETELRSLIRQLGEGGVRIIQVEVYKAPTPYIPPPNFAAIMKGTTQ